VYRVSYLGRWLPGNQDGSFVLNVVVLDEDCSVRLETGHISCN